ncbi:hypothetical protein HER39_09120, partial [Arthrobacter deserti]|nr:hypothetical protein [Arthrobacter deserti]
AASTPVTINMTNLSHAVRLAEQEYEVGNSSGHVFRFGVASEGLPPGGGCIEQAGDAEDFHSFMTSLISLA